jgi:hypothetical protein
MDIAVVIISSLVSGLIGILVSIYYYRRHERYRMKVDTFRSLMANRYDIQGDQFTRALNEIFIVFQDSEEVLRSLKKFHETIVSKQVDLANDDLVALFKAVCRNLGIDSEKYSESVFVKPFNVKNRGIGS